MDERDPRLKKAEEEGTPVPTFTCTPHVYNKYDCGDTLPLPLPHYQEIYRFTQEVKQRFQADIRSPEADRQRREWSHDPKILKDYQDTCVKQWGLFYRDTYWTYDDVAIGGLYWSDLRPSHLGIAWHATKSARDIEATASLIQSYIPADLALEQRKDWLTIDDIIKEQEYRHIEEELHVCGWACKTFVKTPEYLGNILIDLQQADIDGPHTYTFVIALVCKLRSIASQRYRNFPDIDQFRQILIERYYEQGVLQDSPWLEYFKTGEFRAIKGSWLNGTATPIPFHPSYDSKVSL